MYADIAYYKSLYGEISEMEYNRFAGHAAKLLEKYTTGIDGVHKLRVAFPVDLDDAEWVKRCECALVDLLKRVNVAENAASAHVDANGMTVRGAVSSVSSGAESISYGGEGSAINTAVSDISARERLYAATIREHLCGVKDAKGVNLLYMGVYPHVL